MLDSGLRDTFGERGLVGIEGFLPRDRVAAAQEVVREALRGTDGGAAGAARNALARVKKSAAFGQLLTPALEAVARDLCDGEPVVPMQAVPNLLVTPPEATRWRVPHGMWHCDLPRLRCGRPGVQVFTFLEEVGPGGGATLVLCGSHRFFAAGELIHSRDVKRRLRRIAWFREFFRPDFGGRDACMASPSLVEGVPIRVVELTGAPGDVYWMDLRVLHTLAPNASSRPRVMLTHRYLRPEAFREAAQWVSPTARAS